MAFETGGMLTEPTMKRTYRPEEFEKKKFGTDMDRNKWDKHGRKWDKDVLDKYGLDKGGKWDKYDRMDKFDTDKNRMGKSWDKYGIDKWDTGRKWDKYGMNRGKWDKYGMDRKWDTGRKWDKYGMDRGKGGKWDKYGMGRKWDMYDMDRRRMGKFGKDKYGLGKYGLGRRWDEFEPGFRRFDEFGGMGYDRRGIKDWDSLRREQKLGRMHGMEGLRGMRGIDKKKKKGRKWAPIADIGKTKKHWIIRTELPGVPKHKIRVEVRGKELIIEGKRSKKLHFHHTKLGKGLESGVTTEKKGEGLLEKGKEVLKESVGAKDVKKEKGLGVKKDRKDKKEKKEKKSLEKVRWMVKERGSKGKFKRRLMLPEKAHPERVEALYKDGVLEVLLPRRKFHGEEKEKVGHHHVPIH